MDEQKLSLEVPNERRQHNSGDRREITVGAVVAAAALAWTVSSAWIGFRDGVFDRLSDLDGRLASTIQTLAAHVQSDTDRYQQFTGEFQRHVFTRLDRLEQRIERAEQGRNQ